MNDPVFWLALSLFLVAISLTAVLVAAFPVFLELARVARSAEKILDIIQQELPAILESVRLTGEEVSEISNDVNGSVKSATKVIQRVDRGVTTAKNQAQGVNKQTRGVITGIRVAWKTWRDRG